MAEATDEPLTFTKSPSERWRVPLRLGVPIVVACGLLGYALSLLAPIHSPAIAPPKAASAGLSVVESPPPAAAGETPADATREVKAEPERDTATAPKAGPVIETGSVEQAERSAPVAAPAATLPPAAPAAAIAPSDEKPARNYVPRRPRAYYRPPAPAPKPAVRPFDPLWPSFPK